MGPRLVCPASKLNANYNYTTSKLELHAEGEVPVDWHNMYFHQEPMRQGLKFTVYAYGFYGGVNPIKRKYSLSEEFTIGNIHQAAPTGSVLICDQASPTTGNPVRIEPNSGHPTP